MPESFEVRISFPLFTLTEDGDSVMILGFGEEDVCPLFRSKELAELYIEQSGQASLTCLPLPTPAHLCSILRAIETEVDTRTISGLHCVSISSGKIAFDLDRAADCVQPRNDKATRHDRIARVGVAALGDCSARARQMTDSSRADAMFIHCHRIVMIAMEVRDRSFAEDQERVLPSTTDAVVAVIMAACASEAFINELGEFMEICRSGGMPAEPLRAKLEQIGTDLPELEKKRASILRKYNAAAQILSGKVFDEGANPFKNFKTLVELRNSLVHLKAIDRFSLDDTCDLKSTPPEVILSLQQSGIAREMSKHRNESWFDLIQTPDVAHWACETAIGMIQAVLNMVPDGTEADPEPTRFFKEHFRRLEKDLKDEASKPRRAKGTDVRDT